MFVHKGQLQNVISQSTLNILGRFKLEMKIWLDSFQTPGQKLDSDEKRVRYDHMKRSSQADSVSRTLYMSKTPEPHTLVDLDTVSRTRNKKSCV